METTNKKNQELTFLLKSRKLESELERSSYITEEQRKTVFAYAEEAISLSTLNTANFQVRCELLFKISMRSNGRLILLRELIKNTREINKEKVRLRKKLISKRETALKNPTDKILKELCEDSKRVVDLHLVCKDYFNDNVGTLLHTYYAKREYYDLNNECYHHALKLINKKD